jgi:hypothetical protein
MECPLSNGHHGEELRTGPDARRRRAHGSCSRAVMKKTKKPSPLVAVLLPEVFQTEESALLHPTREANRLAGTPPAAAMLAVAEHAKESLGALRRLVEERGQPGAKAGTTLGRIFSVVRDFGTDLFLSSEKSYRATILGVRHGIGVFLFLEDAAIASGDQQLADYCAEWLAVRTKLAERIEHELAWFAEHPEVAMTRAHSKIAVRRVLEKNPQWQSPSTRSS